MRRTCAQCPWPSQRFGSTRPRGSQSCQSWSSCACPWGWCGCGASSRRAGSHTASRRWWPPVTKGHSSNRGAGKEGQTHGGRERGVTLLNQHEFTNLTPNEYSMYPLTVLECQRNQVSLLWCFFLTQAILTRFSCSLVVFCSVISDLMNLVSFPP